MLIAAILLFAIFIWVFARESWLGNHIHQLLVEQPARALNRLSVGHIICVLALSTLVGAFIWYGGLDGLRMVGMGLPDIVALFTTFEIGTYVDALVMLAAISAVTRFRIVRLIIAPHLARILPRRTRSRSRGRRSRQRTKSIPTNEDEDGLWFAYAT